MTVCILWRETTNTITTFIIDCIGLASQPVVNKMPFTPAIGISHYNDVIIGAMTSEIAGVSIVCSTVCASVDQRKYLNSASLALDWWQVIRKLFPFDDVIMLSARIRLRYDKNFLILKSTPIEQNITVMKYERYGVADQQQIECLVNGLFKFIPKNTSKPMLLDLCEHNAPVTSEFPRKASSAVNVCVTWHYQEVYSYRGSLWPMWLISLQLKQNACLCFIKWEKTQNAYITFYYLWIKPAVDQMHADTLPFKL